MSNAERFLDAYISIENALSRIARESRYVPFARLLGRCAKTNKIVAINEQSLREYNELRNAIVHDRGKANEIIAEPCDSVTNDIERIASLLNEDANILSFASSPVRTVRSDEDIVEAFKLMDRLDTSKIPVYDDRNYVGIATLEEVARWGLEKKHTDRRVASILVSNRNERVLFLKKNSSVESAMSAFESALNHGHVLLAILITEHGNMNEKPLGIITVADLPKILKSFG